MSRSPIRVPPVNLCVWNDAVVIVVVTNNIVFPKILTVLNLDNHEGNHPGIFEAMLTARGDKGGFIVRQHLLATVAGYLGSAGNHNPIAGGAW